MSRAAAVCLVILLSCASALAGPAAGPADPPRALTVGDFAVRMATRLGLNAAPGTAGAHTPESASWALWRVGVHLRSALNEPLTENDVTLALQQIGFRIVASDARRAVDGERAELILSTFVNASTLERLKLSSDVTAADNGDDDFNNGNGKGGKYKRKGPKSPSGAY